MTDTVGTTPDSTAAYDPRLTNEDLAPLKEQSWTSYNFFAFWMSDVHSVGGYLTAGSLFALGLAAWQVLVALLVGITIVYLLCNLVARPSQATGTPYPVISRVSFGVLGANVPAIIRGLIAVAWYGIQTYLASHSLVIVALTLWPGLAPGADVSRYGFLGLSLVGWVAFLIMWVAQAAVFWKGMEAIRRFIDFCGPAVYVVMFLLAGYLVFAAGIENIDLNLSEVSLSGWSVVGTMLVRDRAGRLVLLRPDAQLRRLRPLRAQLRRGEARQLPRPAGQLHRVRAARGDHRRCDEAGVR